MTPESVCGGFDKRRAQAKVKFMFESTQCYHYRKEKEDALTIAGHSEKCYWKWKGKESN